jgi:hypothetical protein
MARDRRTSSRWRRGQIRARDPPRRSAGEVLRSAPGRSVQASCGAAPPSGSQSTPGGWATPAEARTLSHTWERVRTSPGLCGVTARAARAWLRTRRCPGPPQTARPPSPRRRTLRISSGEFIRSWGGAGWNHPPPPLRTRRCLERRKPPGRRARAGGLCAFPAANSFALGAGFAMSLHRIRPLLGRTSRCPCIEFIRSRGAPRDVGVN